MFYGYIHFHRWKTSYIMCNTKLYWLFLITLCISYSVSAQPEQDGDSDDSPSDPEQSHNAPDQSHLSGGYKADELSHAAFPHAPAPQLPNHGAQGHPPSKHFGSMYSGNRPHMAPSPNRLAVPPRPHHHLSPFASYNPLGQHPPRGHQAPFDQSQMVHPQLDQRQPLPVWGHRNDVQQDRTDGSHVPQSNHAAHAPPQRSSLHDLLKPRPSHHN